MSAVAALDPPERDSPDRWRWRAAWPAGLLGVLVLAGYAWSAPHDGDFWWYDSARHAMNSIFIHDFFAQGGWRDPIAFARAYYAQYPGINIGFYPPFLYLATAPVLGIFGVSHAVCQAVVAAFAAALAVGGYAVARPVIGRAGAFALGLMLVLVPEVALWGRQVQLDVPALSLLVWGAWALARFLEAPRTRWLVLGAVLLGCAMLTRVQTVFAWPLWLAVVFVHPVGRAQPWRGRLAATGLYGLLALPAVASVLYFSSVVGSLAGKMPDMPPLVSWWNWGWYAARFPEQLGAAGLALLLLGLAAWLLRAPSQWLAAVRGRAGLMLAMALLAWGFFSIVSNKEPRFGLPILPFAMLSAGLVLGRWSTAGGMAKVSMPMPMPMPVVVPALAALMLVEAAVSGRWSDVPRLTGHQEAAQAAARLAPRDARVLISAHRDGNFIVAMRADTARPDLAVRRADKLLVEMTIMRQLGIRDRGLDEPAIRALLDRERVDVVVSQTGYLGDQPSMQALQRLLDSDCCFVLRETIPITGRHRPDERELRVYARR